MRVRVGRNLEAFPLPAAMTKAQRCALEQRMLKAFKVLMALPEYGGHYVSITPGHENEINEEEYEALIQSHIMFKDMAADAYLASAGIAADWPYGRGCYISEDQGFIVWVGEEDHLRIMCMEKGTVLNSIFDRLRSALDIIGSEDLGLQIATSPDYGVVTSCPTNLGTAMRASVHIALPKLTAGGSVCSHKYDEFLLTLHNNLLSTLIISGRGGKKCCWGSWPFCPRSWWRTHGCWRRRYCRYLATGA
eukprot:SAG31_NODE_7735_length_1606_cov_1.633709_2_plen_247_part_01